jgi:hypothetical protein
MLELVDHEYCWQGNQLKGEVVMEVFAISSDPYQAQVIFGMVCENIFRRD